MNVAQPIRTPFGISVFGSAIIRAEPDIASLKFAVSRLEQNPREAFRAAREGSQRVWDYLTQAKLNDVGTSRMTLSQTYDYTPKRFLGYTAKIAYHVLLRDLDRTEEILAGIIDAGVNDVSGVEFQSSRLKELRAEVRRRAVQAAREKALLYCEAASITLGPVIHLEDVNPEVLRGSEGHVTREIQPDDGDTVKAFDPASIRVGGAVIMAFEIGR
jgi:uncharacterized protein YggE